MIDSIKKILFTGSLKGQYLSELIFDLSDTLNDENIELYCFSQSNGQIDLPNVQTIEEKNISDMDLIVSIGGDGTNTHFLCCSWFYRR